MLELGGNIYFTAKLGATDGLSFQQVAAMMTGSTQQDYADMMLAGGRMSKATAASQNGRTRMAKIVAGVWTSHVPAIGAALDLGKTRSPTGSACSPASRNRRNGSRR